eukprot:scaffold10.g2441.t1
MVSAWVLETGRRVASKALLFVALDLLIGQGPLRPFIYRAFRVDPQRDAKGAKRLASQLAAKLVGVVFLAWVLPQTFRALAESAVHNDRLYGVTQLSQATMELASAYFIYDLYLCAFKFAENGWEFLLHASICCTVYTSAVFTGGLHYFGCGFLLWELSTPFLYTRWVLLKAGFADSWMLSVTNGYFMLTFFLCRNVWGTVLSGEFFQASQKEMAAPRGHFPAAAFPPIIVMCAALNGLNLWWLVQMITIVLGWRDKPKTKEA